MTRGEAIQFLESLKDCIEKTAPILSPDFGKAIFSIKNEKIKLDRSRWKMCEWCESAQYWGNKYCSKCGRPLTKEAWADLERRINGETV